MLYTSEAAAAPNSKKRTKHLKSFFFINHLSPYGPVWLNVLWPYANVAKETVNASHIYTPITTSRPPTRLHRRLRFWADKRKFGADIRDEVRRNLDPNGPNVLFVKALSLMDIEWTSVLHPIWSMFDKRVLMLADPIPPKQRLAGAISRFDLVTSFCGDLALEYTEEFGVPAIYVPPHTDALRFHNAGNYRPIDLSIVGRRLDRLHVPLHKHFNDPAQPRVFIDFVTRTRRKPERSLEEEFGLLMSTYAKTAATFCWAPVHWHRFEGRSPLTGRWAHAWASGCTVLGNRPTGRGVEEATDWPESIIELPTEPEEAISVIEELLSDTEGMERRRRRNVYEALMRHDSRYRLRSILIELGLPLTDTLLEDLRKLENLAAKFRPQI